MNKPSFCFIIPRTPPQFQTELRNELWSLTKESLLSQSYQDWKAVIVVNDDVPADEDSRFVYFQSDAIIKGDKLKLGIEYIKTNINPDYIIRLDDDDVIMADAIEMASCEDFDVYTDMYHTYYDICSGMICQRRRQDCMANTTIHKFEHAIKMQDNGYPLLNQDHSKAWHVFYKDKKVFYACREKPLYVRILCPQSVTSNLRNSYFEYLQEFGVWGECVLKDFSPYRLKLEKIAKEMLLTTFCKRPDSIISIALYKLKKVIKKILG